MKLYLDTETRSAAKLNTTGVSKYVADPYFKVLLCSWAIDDEPVRLWEPINGEPIPTRLLRALVAKSTRIVIANSSFDRRAINASPDFPCTVEAAQILDTMVQGYAHGLPGSLEQQCQLFGLGKELGKMDIGRKLIQIFCVPKYGTNPPEFNSPADFPGEWEDFKRYAVRDTEAMREVHKRMPTVNYPNLEHRLWVIDQKINERGIPVDVELAEAADYERLLERERLKRQANSSTDGDVPAATQRAKLLDYINTTFGVTMPDLKASTIERWLGFEDLPEEAKALLRLRSEASLTAPAKYKKILERQIDGRLKDTIQFCGASRTGRDSGRFFQPQNLPRPTRWKGLEGTELDEAIALDVHAIKTGVADMVDSNVMDLLGNCVRSVIAAPSGRKLVVSDLSNIEGRGLVWLSGEEWKLKFFRDFDAGRVAFDNYVTAYANALNMNPGDVTKYQRQIGKVLELGCFGAETRVLTDNGWKRIIDVEIEDNLWDGKSWVKHQGVIAKGVKETIDLKGVAVTPEHLIKTGRTWTQAQQLVSDESILNRALETARENSPSLGLSEAPLGVCEKSSSNARVAPTLTKFTQTISSGVRLLGAMLAPRNLQREPERSFTATQTSAQMMLTEPDFSTEYPPASRDAEAPMTGSGATTGAVGFTFSMNGKPGQQGAERFSNTLSRLKGGITRNFRLTVWTTIKGTSRAIYGLLPHGKTRITAERFTNSKTRSTKPMPVFDILNVGSNHCFTIATKAGPLLAHNCGYGGGVAAFLNYVAVYKLDIDELADATFEVADKHLLNECWDKYEWAKDNKYHAGLKQKQYAACEYLKTSWRRAHPNTVKFWSDLENAFRVCTAEEGVVVTVGRLKFKRKGQWLYIRLPSGRCLVYLQPKIIDGECTFVGRDSFTKRLQKIKTYSGKLAENVTSAVSRDVMIHRLPDVENAGYSVVMRVHDELVTETPDTPGFNPEDLSKIMTRPYEWSDGLPLAAAGFQAYRYRKD